ncbi:MAG: YbjQ family protein [Clostridia bacterium]|nr:YbjQ family protein [Clostridia bacterium]
MLISTTSSLEGRKIKEYRGIVFGEVINGVNYMRDFAAGITNIIGGRSAEYEEEVINTRADALNEMMMRAEKVGANAVIGVKVDYETISNMLMVVATGTAVVIE